MTYLESVLILAGFVIGMMPIYIMLGANLMEDWQEKQKQEEEQE